MSDRHIDAFEYFVSAEGNDKLGDGTSMRPFRTVERAVSHVRHRYEGSATSVQGLTGPAHVEIVAIRAPEVGSALEGDRDLNTSSIPWPKEKAPRERTVSVA